MVNRILMSVFILLFALSISAHAVNIDSLKAELSHTSGQEKYELLVLIGEQILIVDANQATDYSREAYQNCDNKETKLLALSNMIDAFKQLEIDDSVYFYLEEALQLSYDVNDLRRTSLYLSARGGKYYIEGDINMAANDFKTSLHVFNEYVADVGDSEKIDSTNLAALTNSLGAVYAKIGQFDSAIYYFHQSLEYKRKTQASPESISKSLSNLCGLSIYRDDFERGKVFGLEALELSETISDSIGIARTLVSIGVCEKRLGDTAQAIKYYHRALDIGRKINRRITISSSLTNLGILYLNMGEWEKAGKYLNESLRFNENSKNKVSYSNILSNVANYYFEIGKHDSSVFYAHKSLVLSLEARNARIVENNYKLIAKAAAELKDYEEAYNYSVLSKQLHDSLFNIESTARFDELQIKYEIAEGEREIIELKLENEVQLSEKKKLWILLGFVSLVFGFMLFLVYLKRKKDEEIHHQQSLVLVKENELSQSELEKSQLQEQELKNEIQYKSRQLTTHALNMMQKNTLMQEIQEELVVIAKKANTDNKPALNRIKMLIKKKLRSEKDWDLFKLYFEDVNKQFYKELSNISTELTPNDLKLCALLKLNMNIKESASVMNIEPASVKTARYKLRKKLDLKPEDDLVEFIRKIG